jgi:hypothetical protein
MEKFVVCTLDGIEAILGNTFLDVYRVDVLEGGLKLIVIARLAYRSTSLKVEY